METERFKKSEVSKLRIWYWKLSDFVDLKVHHFLVKLSGDEQVKELYQEMEDCYLDGDQPGMLEASEKLRQETLYSHFSEQNVGEQA